MEAGESVASTSAQEVLILPYITVQVSLKQQRHESYRDMQSILMQHVSADISSFSMTYKKLFRMSQCVRNPSIQHEPCRL